MIANDRIRCPLSTTIGFRKEKIWFFFWLEYIYRCGYSFQSVWMDVSDMVSFKRQRNEMPMSNSEAKMTSIDYINQHFDCCSTGNAQYHSLHRFLRKISVVYLNVEHLSSTGKHAEIVFAIEKKVHFHSNNNDCSLLKSPPTSIK